MVQGGVAGWGGYRIGVVIRPVELPADRTRLDELFGLIRQCDGHWPIGEHKYLSLRDGDPEQVVGLVGEEDERIVVYIAVSSSREPGVWALELAVHPLHRDDATLRRALQAGLEHLALRGCRRVRAWAFLPRFVDVLLNHGFRPERELRQLRRELPVPTPATFPAGVEVRGFRLGRDEEAWLEVNNAAFAGHPENGAWTREILEDRQRQPWFSAEGFRMAWEGDKLVGFCWTKLHRRQVGEIYVIAVHPSAQGRGLGRALVLEGLRHLHDVEGATTGMLYVDADNHPALRLYEELGFRLDHVDRSFVIQLG